MIVCKAWLVDLPRAYWGSRIDCRRSDERTRLDDCPSSVHTPRYENTLASGIQVRLMWRILGANPQELKSDWI